MSRFAAICLLAQFLVLGSSAAFATDSAAPDYFTAYPHLRMTREDGILVVEMHNDGKPLTFTAADHTAFADAFYAIGRDRANKVVILTGAGGDWVPAVDCGSFGPVDDPNVWAQVHDDGVQLLENLANIRVPLICAVEGRAWVHTEYCLLANYIVTGQDASFHDLPHILGGIAPGDGIYTVWSYVAGPGRAQRFLLEPQPVPARMAQTWGVVSEIVPDGAALDRARELARSWLSKPELTLRNTRIHFIQPLKERLVREVGYGLLLEGESADALIHRVME
jgi:enoyl-CoA hydratase/carnithine racemase